MNRKLRMGMVGGGKDAFIGAIHRLAANMDGLIEVVCGALSINAEIAKDSSPTVLCGDFNMTPIGRRYQILASKGQDAFAEVGTGFGWTSPSGIPMRRIDYVWAFNGTRPLEAHTVDYRASDHAAVVATIEIK